MSYPKFTYYRSRKHLQAVARLPCQYCGLVGSTQASHSNQAIHGKGRSLKSSDEFTAALCSRCHAEVDQGRVMSRSQRVAVWQAAFVGTVRELVKLGQWPDGVAVPDLQGEI